MSRIPFVAAVVGALLIGGATTGGTHASWVSTAQLSGKSTAGYSVKSGNIGLTAPSNAAFASNFGKSGPAQTTTFTVTDNSAGKNLKQQVTASVSQPSGFTVTVGATCAAATSASATSANNIGPAPTTKTTTFCVKATPGSGAVTGSITVTLDGQQKPAGWTAPSQQFTIPVTVNAPAPTAPTLSCSPGRQNNNDFAFSWSAVTGATGYTVYVAGANADANYGPVTGMPTTSTSLTVNGFTDNVDRFYRVKVTTASGTSGYSNTIKITRTGNGSGNFNCSGVTP